LSPLNRAKKKKEEEEEENTFGGRKQQLDVILWILWGLQEFRVVWVKLLGVAAVPHPCPLGELCHTLQQRCGDYKELILAVTKVLSL